MKNLFRIITQFLKIEDTVIIITAREFDAVSFLTFMYSFFMLSFVALFFFLILFFNLMLHGLCSIQKRFFLFIYGGSTLFRIYR